MAGCTELLCHYFLAVFMFWVLMVCQLFGGCCWQNIWTAICVEYICFMFGLENQFVVI